MVVHSVRALRASSCDSDASAFAYRLSKRGVVLDAILTLPLIYVPTVSFHQEIKPRVHASRDTSPKHITPLESADFIGVMNLQSELRVDGTTEGEWGLIKTRLEQYCSANGITDDTIKEYMLMLGRYDYFGAPSNWDPRWNHEPVIWRWAVWLKSKEERYKQRIRRCQALYDENMIPECSDIMIDYFT